MKTNRILFLVVRMLTLAVLFSGCTQNQPGVVDSPSDEFLAATKQSSTEGVPPTLVSGGSSQLIDLPRSCLEAEGISLCVSSAGDAVNYIGANATRSGINPIIPGDAIQLLYELGGSPEGAVGYSAILIQGPGNYELHLDPDPIYLSSQGEEIYNATELLLPGQSEEALSFHGALIASAPPQVLGADAPLFVPYTGTAIMQHTGFFANCGQGDFQTNPNQSEVEVIAEANTLVLRDLSSGYQMDFTRSGPYNYSGTLSVSDSGVTQNYQTVLTVLSPTYITATQVLEETSGCTGSGEFVLTYTGSPTTWTCNLGVEDQANAGCFKDCTDGLCFSGSPDPCANVACPTDQVCYQGGCFDELTMEIQQVLTDPCDGVSCPTDQVCYQGGCFELNACLNVDCPADQVCYQGGCFDDCGVSSSVDVCYIAFPDVCKDVQCSSGFTCVSGACVSYGLSEEIGRLPGDAFSIGEPTAPTESTDNDQNVLIQIVPMEISDPQSQEINNVDFVYLVMTQANTFIEGDPDRPLLRPELVRFYRLDPKSGRQTLWNDVILLEDGLAIQTNETTLFAVYVFESEEAAENTSQVLFPAVQK